MTINKAVERAKHQININWTLQTKTEEQNMLDTLVKYVTQVEAAKEKIRKIINDLNSFDICREDVFINGYVTAAEFFLKELEVEDGNEA